MPMRKNSPSAASTSRCPSELYCGPLKSRASYRTIALDQAFTQRLAEQAVRQSVELLEHRFAEQRRSDSRARTGTGWRAGQPLFTYADGRPIRPEYLTTPVPHARQRPRPAADPAT
jgi:hypothetical protein